MNIITIYIKLFLLLLDKSNLSYFKANNSWLSRVRNLDSDYAFCVWFLFILLLGIGQICNYNRARYGIFLRSYDFNNLKRKNRSRHFFKLEHVFYKKYIRKKIGKQQLSLTSVRRKGRRPKFWKLALNSENSVNWRSFLKFTFKIW